MNFSRPISIASTSTFDFRGLVERVRTRPSSKILVLEGGLEIEVPRHSCVGIRDELVITKRAGRLRVEAACDNGTALVLPAFRFSRRFSGVAGRLVVREAKSEDDLRAYESLASYHYRAHESFGRRAILVAYLDRDGVESIAGYLELNNTFAGNKARNDLLDAAFEDSSGVAWERWNVDARKKHLNAIARIGRCVVHPELRGAGVGVMLCTAAIEFCKSHWHISKTKPLFLEITADMLKFVPFAQSAGMRYVGTTSGNLGRVRKDQVYLNRILGEIESGAREKESHSVFAANAKSIFQKQRADVDRVRKIAADNGIGVDQMLSVFLDADSPEGMTPKAYELLNSLLRFPKPTYMIGLTEDSTAFLSQRLSEKRPTPPESMAARLRPRSIAKPVLVKNLSISYSHLIAEGAWANAIREAFGIDRSVFSLTGVNLLNLEVSPGELIYVWGPSGSGKTGFLDALRGELKPSAGEIKNLRPSECAVFSLVFSDSPAIEQLGLSDLKEALFCMNTAGLSEAALYFKHPSMLSTGQRHRLAIAKLIASKRSVWIVDEFCSVLDDITAAIVAKNVGKVVRSLGVTAFIAGPRRDLVISALTPDGVLALDSLGKWTFSRTG